MDITKRRRSRKEPTKLAIVTHYTGEWSQRLAHAALAVNEPIDVFAKKAILGRIIMVLGIKNVTGIDTGRVEDDENDQETSSPTSSIIVNPMLGTLATLAVRHMHLARHIRF